MRDLLDMLNIDAQVAVAHLTLLVSGVGDCLKVALGRDREVNNAALSAVVRPCLEVAGQLVWLLDDRISGRARARRYTSWLFSDLKSQRLLLRDGTQSDHSLAAAKHLDSLEHHLIGQVDATGWEAKPTVHRENGVEAATLLAPDGRPEKVPGYRDLASFTSSTRTAYSLLSVAVHGSRFGVMNGLEMSEEPNLDGSTNSTLKGFGLPTNTTIAMAGLSLDTPVRLLSDWTGTDCSAFVRSSQALVRGCGFSPS